MDFLRYISITCAKKGSLGEALADSIKPLNLIVFYRDFCRL